MRDVPSTPEIIEPAAKMSSTLEKIKYILKNITVEPILFLLMAPRLICSLTNENLNLEKACYVNLEYNDSICNAMVLRNRSGYTSEQEIAVQRVVSGLLPYKQFCHIIMIITILLVTGWCDRTQKRKPMFYFPFIGDISALMGYMVCVYFFMDLGAQYSIFVEGILTIAFGGFQLLLAGSYSYVATITDEKSRTMRIGAVTMVTWTSTSLGIALSGICFKYLGFYGVYMLAIGMNSLGLIYALIFIKDKVLKDHAKADTNPSCCDKIWSGTLDSLADCFKTCFRKGQNRRRGKMVILQILNFLAFGIQTGESGVMYLFSRKVFGWDEVDFSMYKAYLTVIQISASTIVLACFSKYLKCDDVTIGIISVISRLIGNIVQSFSTTGWLFYLASLHELFSSMTMISVRSLITKIVNKNEQSMVNSMTCVIDSIGLIILAPSMSFIYHKTVGIFPGAFYLISVTVSILLLILLCILRRLMKEEKS